MEKTKQEARNERHLHLDESDQERQKVLNFQTIASTNNALDCGTVVPTDHEKYSNHFNVHHISINIHLDPVAGDIVLGCECMEYVNMYDCVTSPQLCHIIIQLHHRAGYYYSIISTFYNFLIKDRKLNYYRHKIDASATFR